MRRRHRPALDAQGRARLGEYEARKQTRPCPAPIDVIALGGVSFKTGASPEIESDAERGDGV